MPWTLADVFAAQGYYLTTQVDPRLGDGLGYPLGTMVVYAPAPGSCVILQKQSAIDGDPTAWVSPGGGGGGGQIPVLAVNPVAPAVNQQWFIHTPFGGIVSSQAILNQMANNFNIVVNSTVTADLAKFAVNVGNTQWSFEINITGAEAPPAGAVNLSGVFWLNVGEPGGFLLTVINPTVETIADMNTVINNWATANLAAGVSPIISLFTPADGALLLSTDSPQSTQVSLTSTESFTLNIQGTSAIFAIQSAIA
jgi:hypothetical protein